MLRSHRGGLVTLALLAPAALLLAAILIWPVLELASRSFRDAGGPFVYYSRVIEVSTYLQVLLRTVLFAIGTAAICLALGYPVAFKLATARPLIKALILACVLL